MTVSELLNVHMEFDFLHGRYIAVNQDNDVRVYRNVGAAIWNIDDENLCAIIYAGLLIERVKE